MVSTLRARTSRADTNVANSFDRAGGDSSHGESVKEKSQTRCRIATDAGYTRADGGNSAYCCLFFARGCCPYG